jgi:hypothetical protein
MFNAIPNDFQSFFITGCRNIGKTTYALVCSASVYEMLGHSKKESWELSLGSLCFSIPEVVAYLKEGLDDKKALLIWDDTRVHASGSVYFTNIRLVQQLIRLFDSIRTCCNNILLTAPSTKGLLTFLNTYDDYEVKVHLSPDGGLYRLAKGYKWTTTPAGQRRVYKKFRDNYVCRMPNDIYIRYMKRRKDATKEAIFGVEKAYEKTAKEEGL